MSLVNEIKASSENKDTEHDTKIDDIVGDIKDVKKDFDAKFNQLWRVVSGIAVFIVLSGLGLWLYK